MARPIALSEHVALRGIDRHSLLFATKAGTPISRNTFRTRIWKPAVELSGIGFAIRIDDLRHAHACRLLAGGMDLKSVMDRMGHAQT
jgi:site-specific recombinase XerD